MKYYLDSLRRYPNTPLRTLRCPCPLWLYLSFRVVSQGFVLIKDWRSSLSSLRARAVLRSAHLCFLLPDPGRILSPLRLTSSYLDLGCMDEGATFFFFLTSPDSGILSGELQRSIIRADVAGLWIETLSSIEVASSF